MRWPAKRIKALRESYKESQEDFCRRLGVGIDALRFWEQGRGVPNGSAQILMDRLEEDLSSGKIRPQLQPA